MTEHFDAIVIGAGISGETCAHRLRQGGMRVALIEREHIGGECAYWAALPTTTLMGPANAQWRAQALAGIVSPALASPRDLTPSAILLSSLDEAIQVDAIESEGGSFIRGTARFIGRGRIEVETESDTRQFQSLHIVIATGSEPAIPQIPGLSDIGFWTNREATTAEAIPQQAVILGEEAQAIEIGQMLRLYGAEVTLITRQDHLLATEDPEIGRLLADRLHQQGIRVVSGHSVMRVGRDADHPCVLALDDQTEIHTQRLIVAARRRPRIDGLNLSAAGAQFGASGIVIDKTCRAAEGVWAIGAVTGIAQFSHMAQYQARIAADDILGQPHPACYHSVPRILYTDPQIAFTGQTTAQMAANETADIISVTVDLKERMTHPTSTRQPENGKLALFADVAHGTVVGARAVATEASEWIQLVVHAIRSEIPLDVLRDILEQFPPFGEIYLTAVDQLLAASIQRRGRGQSLQMMYSTGQETRPVQD